MNIVSLFSIFNKPSIYSPSSPVWANTFVVVIIFGTLDLFRKAFADFLLKKLCSVLCFFFFAIFTVSVGSIPNKFLKPKFLNSSNNEPSAQPISNIKSDDLSLYKLFVFFANASKFSLICFDIPGV